MKKLILIVILVIVCAAILLFGLGLTLSWITGFSFSSGGLSTFSYADSSSYSVGEGKVDGKVDSISVNWLNGDISVSTYDGKEVVIREEVVKGKINEDRTLRWKKKGDQILIQYAVGGKKLDLNGFVKNLEILIPATMSLETLDINGVSTDSIVEVSSLEKLKWKSVNGDFNGSFDSLKEAKLDTVNGTLAITVRESYPEKLDADSVNGSVTLTVPENVSATIKYKSVNGKFSSEIAGKPEGKNSFIIGSGKADWSIENVNGSLRVNAL